MGLPIDRLVCATNENDVLDEFFRTGVYRVRGAAETHATSSPSMDISRASNFERFVFDLVGRDRGAIARAVARARDDGRFDLSSSPVFADVAARHGFASGACNHADMIATIRGVHAATGRIVDPHTAVAVKVARERMRDGETMVVLETAQPAKFASTIREALGVEPPVPPGHEDLLDRPQRSVELPADVEALKRYLVAHGD